MANFNKSNCQSCIRQSINLCNGYSTTQIIVTGKHSFEYTVMVLAPGYNKSLIFPKREKALKEVRRLKTQYNSLGYCRLLM